MQEISLPEPLKLQLKACRTLPSIPAVVLEVLDICQDEDVSIGQVSKVLMRDPALSGKILKVANSPYYGVRSQVTTLERAVTILGINATLSLALSFSLVRGLQNGRRSGFNHHAFWLRCVISAAASRIIGIWANTANHDELFLAGLLQDIGMLVLSEAIPDSYGEIISLTQENHTLLAEMEKKEYGCDHATVGAWLLKRWNLPLNLQMAALASHGEAVGEEELPVFSKCVMLANYIAAVWTQPDTIEATTAAKDKAEEILQISTEQFEDILNDVAQILPEVTENLEINIGGEEFIDRVMDEARGALVELSLHAHQMIQEIELQAKRDELTSLANRAYLNEILPQQFIAAREMSRPFSVLFIDIDRFKSINDTYGHQGGDSILTSVARVLRSCTREFDVVARYGGDEFVILLANTGEKASLHLSRRIQEAVMVHPHMIDEVTKIAVTISVGCATFSADQPFLSANELIEAADRCLYSAKTTGRNRVVSFNQMNSRNISSADCA
ncbi:MAG: GGDEF domain-containing protein [Acidobacteria bacterium]|nr:GGDEF domain-containing protein [Acidobacteriota bacterium]